MLYSLGHGQHTYMEKGSRTAPSSAGRPLDRTMERPPRNPEQIGGRFAYYFRTAPQVRHAEDSVRALDELAEAMIEQRPGDTASNAPIPPIYTYFGQFVDHDVTANTDRESGASRIGADDLTPLSRHRVERDLLNLRDGSLRLDSLYGDGPGGGPFSRKLMELMRFPPDRAKMRLGFPVEIADQRVPLPEDGASDLLRIGRLLADDASEGVTLEELRSLPGSLPASFLDDEGRPVVQRAVIGDARNDENLIVAQLQVAFLRFHNRTVDFLRAGEMRDASAEELHAASRRLVVWHYQWLIVNDFLRRLCREDVRDFVVSREAPLYTDFLVRNATCDTGKLPIPLEFSVAAYRFGHTLVRSGYDYNRFFGAPAPREVANLPEASLELLFRFTGNARRPMPRAPSGEHDRLPSNWVIEWERFVAEPAAGDRRATRRLDTFLSPPLAGLTDETEGVFAHLGKRNLRRGHRLNLPSAQSCLRAYNAISGANIEALCREELTAGSTGEAVAAGGFDEETPLWFYVLKEAEVREKGERLGMLGSALVAETLIGLVFNDPRSYWNAPGSDGGRWTPADGVRGEEGEVVDDLPSLLRVAGLL